MLFFIILSSSVCSFCSVCSDFIVHPALSGSRISSPAALPPHWIKLTSAGCPVVGRRHCGDIIGSRGVVDEVRGGRGLQRRLSVGGVSRRLEVQIHILVWDDPGGKSLQTEIVLGGLTQRLQVRFPVRTRL